MRQLVLASRNLNKVGEIKTLLEGLPFEVISLRELPVLPPVGGRSADISW